MAVPFPRGKLVNAALMSLHLHSVMACSLPRHLGSVGRLALHQCNMKRSGDLLLFHIRVIREAGRLTLVFGKGTELEQVVGGSLPYYPVTLLRSCDRTALIHCEQLSPKQRPHDIHKTTLHTPLNAEVVPPTEKSSSLYLPLMDLETYSGLKIGLSLCS